MSFELFHARGAAEVVLLPGMLVDMLGGGGVHVHPANRVALEGGSRIRSRHVRCRKYVRKLPSLIADALYWIQPAEWAGHFPIILAKGFKPMTFLDVVFRYGAVPGENEMRAIDTMREVYGIRRVQFNEKEGTVQVEFDASRLKRDAVAKLLRNAGVDVRETVVRA